MLDTVHFQVFEQVAQWAAEEPAEIQAPDGTWIAIGELAYTRDTQELHVYNGNLLNPEGKTVFQGVTIATRYKIQWRIEEERSINPKDGRS